MKLHMTQKSLIFIQQLGLRFIVLFDMPAAVDRSDSVSIVLILNIVVQACQDFLWFVSV